MERREDAALREARIPKDTVKIIAQGIAGLGNLDDDVAAALAPDAEYRVREIIQDAAKFMRHSKRKTLTTDDVSAALRLRNVEPLYGLSSPNPLKFVKVSPPSNLFYVADEEVDLRDFIAQDLPSVPLAPSLSAHWLAIEGTQPSVPQNPSPDETESSVLAKSKREAVADAEVKPLVKHVLSKELQLYFDHVVKQLGGDDERQINMCLKSAAEAPGLQQLLPYFVHYVVTTVGDSLKDLPRLRTCMRFVRALLSNTYFGIEHYCHQLLPVVLTCVVGRKLCKRPAEEDHWSLRDYSALIVASISQRFSQTYPTLQPRITKTLLGALLDVKKPLTTHYGAIVGLTALGRNVVSILLVPHVNAYVAFLEEELSSSSSAVRRIEIAKVYGALVLAVGKCVQMDSRASSARDGDEAMDVSGGVDNDNDGAFLRSLPIEQRTRMNELLPNYEERYAEMFEEFGDRLVPFQSLHGDQFQLAPEALTV